MSATVTDLNVYRELRYAKARPWSSMDDLPDITPLGQVLVREVIREASRMDATTDSKRAARSLDV